MSRILSQDEIDALLSAAGDIAGSSDTPAGDGAAQANVIRYNFRRPDRVSKEQIHSLYFLHDRFARNVSQQTRSISTATAVRSPAAWKPRSRPPAPVKSEMTLGFFTRFAR